MSDPWCWSTTAAHRSASSPIAISPSARWPTGATATDHGSAPVVTGDPDMDLEEAGELMARHAIRRLPVLDGERLTGIVTLDDVVVRTGDTELAHRITSEVTRAALPGFYFYDRGG